MCGARRSRFVRKYAVESRRQYDTSMSDYDRCACARNLAKRRSIPDCAKCKKGYGRFGGGSCRISRAGSLRAPFVLVQRRHTTGHVQVARLTIRSCFLPTADNLRRRGKLFALARDPADAPNCR